MLRPKLCLGPAPCKWLGRGHPASAAPGTGCLCPILSSQPCPPQCSCPGAQGGAGREHPRGPASPAAGHGHTVRPQLRALQELAPTCYSPRDNPGELPCKAAAPGHPGCTPVQGCSISHRLQGQGLAMPPLHRVHPAPVPPSRLHQCQAGAMLGQRPCRASLPVPSCHQRAGTERPAELAQPGSRALAPPATPRQPFPPH